MTCAATSADLPSRAFCTPACPRGAAPQVPNERRLHPRCGCVSTRADLLSRCQHKLTDGSSGSRATSRAAETGGDRDAKRSGARHLGAAVDRTTVRRFLPRRPGRQRPADVEPSARAAAIEGSRHRVGDRPPASDGSSAPRRSPPEALRDAPSTLRSIRELETTPWESDSRDSSPPSRCSTGRGGVQTPPRPS